MLLPCFNPSFGFSPGIILTTQGYKILKSLQGGAEIISDTALKFAQSNIPPIYLLKDLLERNVLCENELYSMTMKDSEALSRHRKHHIQGFCKIYEVR